MMPDATECMGRGSNVLPNQFCFSAAVVVLSTLLTRPINTVTNTTKLLPPTPNTFPLSHAGERGFSVI